ncbi:hypothetical protein ACFLX2_00160 [Candidatus Dependentiae bacterium]
MKKTVLSLICVIGLAAGSASASWIDLPISKTKAFLGSAGIGAGAWWLTKAMFASKNESLFEEGLEPEPTSTFDKSTIFATVAAGVATFLGWKAFRKYTATGYFERGKEIFEGTACGSPELLLLVKLNVGAPKQTAQLVVDLFSAQRNELAKATAALERLFNELCLANYYLKTAQLHLKDSRLDLAQGYRLVIARTITNIKELSLEIKSYEDYQQQYDDELKEMSIRAQYATAHAIRDAGTAPRIQAHYVF